MFTGSAPPGPIRPSCTNSRTPSSRTPSSRTPSTDPVADLDRLPGKRLPDTTWQHSRTDLDDDEPDPPEQTGRAPADRSRPIAVEPSPSSDRSPADHCPDDPVPDARGPDEPEPEPDEDPDGGGDGRPPDAGGTDTEPPARWGKRGLRRRGRDRTVVNIVIDLPTLLGLADNPARLDGYGDIPAGLARRIAADATWRRMITDPITRRLLDRSPNTYRPGQALADYVRARDLTCDHPGCTKPADGCQLDHDNPYNLADPDGGRTTADELKLRCDPHHNGKTHLGWATGVRADGTRFTRSPLGFDYDLEPNPYLDQPQNPYVDHGQKPPTRLSIVTTPTEHHAAEHHAQPSTALPGSTACFRDDHFRVLWSAGTSTAIGEPPPVRRGRCAGLRRRPSSSVHRCESWMRLLCQARQ